MDFTVTYSSRDDAWTSFHSYLPEWMAHMNGTFFSFSRGSMYEHYSNQDRNTYYEIAYNSTVTVILNQSPTDQKVFKTVKTRSTTAWDAFCTTNLNVGFIDSPYFSLNEDNWSTHIRRLPNASGENTSTTKGIGSMLLLTGLVLDFNFNIDGSLSSGDLLYRLNGSTLELLGEVDSHTATSITLVSIGAFTPVPGDVIVYKKNAVAESHPLRGDYMSVKLTNSSLSQEELFIISSSVFKSFV